MNCSYEIMSLDGKVVSKDILTGNQINISNLPDGIYMIQLFDKGASIGVKRL